MFDILTQTYNEAIDPGANLSQFSTIGSVAAFVANLVLAVGVSLSVIGLAAACVLFITSMGDPKAIQKAYMAVLYSIIGGILAFLAFAAKTVLISTLDVTDSNLTNDLPNF